MAKWREVRVFISSTFRDMHAERDHLVKVTFPRLRERLLPYQVHFDDVDLRWGVTREQAENDAALEVCLDQIDACRPFFLGLLGERYGWVPERIRAEVANQYGLAQFMTGKSITELEILYGVLNNPEMRGHAFFYFRDPSAVAVVPDPLRSEVYVDADPALRGKLAALKTAIRASGLPVMEPYPAHWNAAAWDRPRRASGRLDGLEAFGEAVFRQLWEAIRAELELPEAPPTERDEDPLAVERDLHEQFMESRLRVCVGREPLHEELLRYVNGREPGILGVVGAAGSGKSAALAKLCRACEGQFDLLVPHFVGASSGSTDLRQVLRRFCLELSGAFGFADEVPQELDKLVPRFRELVAQVPAERTAVFVIDAVNQLDAGALAESLAWLPAELPPNVRIVVSCIDDPELSVRRALEARAGRLVRVGLLTDEERFEIVHAVPSLSAKTLDAEQVGLLLSNPATQNPLFLLVALEELRGFGSFEEVDGRIVALPHPAETEPAWPAWLEKRRSEVGPDPRKLARLERIEEALRLVAAVADPLTDVFHQVIDRLQQDFDAETVQQALCLLASGRSGMLESDLAELVPGDDLQPVLRQLRAYLQRRGEKLDFFHGQLREAVRARWLGDEEERRGWHRRIAEHLARKGHRHRVTLEELPWQQVRADNVGGWAGTLTTYAFVEAKVRLVGVRDLIADYGLTADTEERLAPDLSASLRLLENAVMRAASVLADDPSQLPTQLFGRLDGHGEATLQVLLATARTTHQPPWLRPMTSSLAFAARPLRGAAQGPAERVVGLAIDPSGRWAAARAADGSLGFWLLPAFTPLCVVAGVAALAFSPGGRRAISTNTAGALSWWDCETWTQSAVGSVHGGPVTCWSFTTDGSQLLTGTADGLLTVWDVATGQRLRDLPGHTAAIIDLALSFDGKQALTASRDGTARLWDLPSGTVSATVTTPGGEGTGGSTALALLGLGRVAVGFGQLAVDLAHRHGGPGGGREVRQAVPGDYCLLVARDGGVAVELGASGQLRACALSSDSLPQVLGGHDGGQCLALTPDGATALTGSRDGSVKLWEPLRSLERWAFRAHDEGVTALAIDPQARLAVSGSERGALRCWDLSTVRAHGDALSREGAVTALAVSPTGRRVYAARGFCAIESWDLSSGERCHTLAEASQRVAAIETSVAWGGVRTLSADGSWRSWALDTGIEVARSNREEGLTALGGGVKGFADGSLLVQADRSDWFEPEPDRWVKGRHRGPVRALAVFDSQELATRFLQPRTPFDVFMRSRGGTLAASASDDGVVGVWDLGTLGLVRWLVGHDGPVQAVAELAGGRQIVSGGADGLVRLWDLSSGETVACLAGHAGEVLALAVMPDGRHVVSASADRTLRVWDLTNGAVEHVLDGHLDAVAAVVVSADGETICSGSHDGTVRFWELRTGAQRSASQAHTARVTALAPYGGQFVSGAWDGTIKFWDPPTGELLRSRGPGTSLSRRVALAPDGQRLVAEGDNALIRWDLANETCSTKSVRPGVRLLCVLPDGRRSLLLANSLRGDTSTDCPDTLFAWDPDHELVPSSLPARVVRNLLDQGVSGLHPGISWNLSAAAPTPDGRGVVTAFANGDIERWDLAYLGQPLRSTPRAAPHCLARGVQRAWSVAVTGDGKHALCAGANGVAVVPLDDTTSTAALIGWGGGVVAVATLPGERYAIAVDETRSLRVWDLGSGEVVCSLTTEAAITAVAATTDGRLIVAGDSLGGVHVLLPEGLAPGTVVLTAWRLPPSAAPFTWRFWQRPAPAPPALPAFGCPHCRTWSEVPASALGTELPCPHCHQPIRLNPFTIDADWRPIAAAWKAPTP